MKLKFGHKKVLPNHTWVCEKGYTGPFCEDAVCDQGCQHGKCLRPGYCTCEDGYKGRACDEAVCSKPCAHGKCTQPDFCLCDDGFFGGVCDQQCEHGTYAVVEQRCRCEQRQLVRAPGVRPQRAAESCILQLSAERSLERRAPRAPCLPGAFGGTSTSPGRPNLPLSEPKSASTR